MKDKRPIEQQVAELTQEQRDMIPKVFIRHIVAIAVVLVIYLVGMFLFITTLDSKKNNDVAVGKYEQLSKEIEELEADIEKLEAEETELENDIMTTEAKYRPQISFDSSGEMQFESNPMSEDARQELLQLTNEKNDIGEKIIELSVEKEEKTIAYNVAFEESKKTLDEWDTEIKKMPVYIGVMFAVFAIFILLISIIISKKYPYYSEKKYFYLRKQNKLQ